MIEGKMRDQEGRTQIEVSMSMNSFVLAFMLIWLAMVAMFGLCGFLFSLGQNTFSWATIIPLLMFILGIALPVGGFQSEAQKSKAFLYDLFEAEQIDNKKK